MSRLAPTAHPLRRSDRRRRAILLLLSPAIVSALLLVVVVGFRLSSGVRAYVGGESLWSKGQKQGVISLFRYAITHDSADFAAYRAAQAVPDAVRRARLELSKDRPDMELVLRALIEGGNHPSDVREMAWLFRAMSNVGHMRRAIGIWTAGDSARGDLDREAERLRALIAAPRQDSVAVRAALGRISVIDDRLTLLEGDFSRTLGEGARWVTRAALVAAVGVGLLLVAIATSVSARMLRQERATIELARRRGEELRIHIENAPDAITRFDADLRCVYANPMALRQTGLPLDGLVGKSLAEIGLNEVALRAAERAFREAFASGSDTELEVPYDSAEKKSHFHVRLVPERGADGTIATVLSVARDMTQLALSQRALREREEELRHAQKMEAVGRLAGGIAHDFNNILTVIGANLEFALEDLSSGGVPHNELEEARRAAERAAGLTRQLLTFSRRQVVQPRVLQLNAIVAETRAMLTRLIGEHIVLETRLDPDVPAVLMDPGQLEQVILNLVVNARDAMPDGGTVRLSTSLSREGPKGGAVLEVRDQGVGMDAATLEHLFEPFFTTKEVGKGTGLGLSTVYGIVTSGGGSIDVTSAPGEGAVFRVFLPSADASALPVAASDAPANVRGSETILLVEDERAIRVLAHRILSRQGYTVLEAENGAQALDRIAEHEGEIHLIVTDVVMPVMGGRALARELARRGRNLPVVFMSGYTDDATPLEGTSDGNAALLIKPFPPVRLLEVVRSELDRRYISPP